MKNLCVINAVLDCNIQKRINAVIPLLERIDELESRCYHDRKGLTCELCSYYYSCSARERESKNRFEEYKVQV